MPRRTQPSLTPAQLEIMNFFWQHGELGVAQVWGLLGARRKVARNTVQTTLTRLVEKGWLKTRVETNAFYFRSARPRRSTLRGILSQLVDTAFAGSATGLVMALLEDRRVSPEEAQRIRELIDRTQGDKQ
jgi:BlaI family transcriptional regulator, penicillinase repressor